MASSATRRVFGILLGVLAVAPVPAQAWFCTPNAENRQPRPRLFSTLRDNFFITGIPTQPETSTDQVEFQISFKFDVLPNEGPCGFYFGYTQRSFWNLWNFRGGQSFQDTNYNPELFVVYGMKDLGNVARISSARSAHFLWARFGVDHESNGQAGAASRGWQRIVGSARFGAWFEPGDIFYVTLEPKAWIPWANPRNAAGGGNPDLVDFVGYGQLDTQFGWYARFGEDRWQDLNLRVQLRKGIVGSRGSVQATLRYRPPLGFTNVALYGEAFFGFAQNLLTFNERTTAWRIGIAFDDRADWKASMASEGLWPPPPP